MTLESAINKYEIVFYANVYKCGFLARPKWPWLNYSPDRIVDEWKNIEITCAFKLRDVDISECFYDKKML